MVGVGPGQNRENLGRVRSALLAYVRCVFFQGCQVAVVTATFLKFGSF
jgi:hypothetical protein